jgi:hypothetical protein
LLTQCGRFKGNFNLQIVVAKFDQTLYTIKETNGNWNLTA